MGSSGNTSLDLENMFLRVGVQAKAVLDPHFQAQVASLLTVNDLVIIFFFLYLGKRKILMIH